MGVEGLYDRGYYGGLGALGVLDVIMGVEGLYEF